MKDFKLINNRTPCTVVLSDPSFDSYHGERIFLNSIGAAWNYYPNELNDEFFDSDITIFGGTALVPRIHDNMTSLLRKPNQKDVLQSLIQYLISGTKKKILQQNGLWVRVRKATDTLIFSLLIRKKLYV